MAFIKSDYLIRGRVDFDHCNKCGRPFRQVAGRIDPVDFRQHKTVHLLEPTTSFADVYLEEHDHIIERQLNTPNAIS
jgi:hypothetical protein